MLSLVQSHVLFYFIGYYVIINFLGYALMSIDKKKAKMHAWRIPERTLMLVAFLGGALGSLLAMQMKRHKTKHTKFVVGVPFCFLLHLCLNAYLIYGWMNK